MSALRVSVFTVGIALLVVVALAYLGAINVAADTPHWAITRALLETARERSIAVRSTDIAVPNLEDPDLLSLGAADYDEMCTVCHLAPGMQDTELRKGLYPQPPLLAHDEPHRGAAQTFWIIKHGIKMTAMPAWGLTHDDHRIWAMVAFVRKLPTLSADRYQALARSAGPHHHHDSHDDQDESTEQTEHSRAEQGEHHDVKEPE